jgi:hypothetical protein
MQTFNMIRADNSGQWKGEQSREDQGDNVVATTVHGYGRFGGPQCLQPQRRSTCILQNTLVVYETIRVIDGYQLSEEHALSIDKVETLVQQILWFWRF